jgi:lipoate-protein ligase A
LEDAIRLLTDEPQTGVRNMAVDEALMLTAQREGRVTLRFYRWEPGCLSFGRNQTARGAFDPEAAADRGIDVVRRPTGGRAVYHHRELTYSVTAPVTTWGSLRETYCLINRALANGLGAVGVPAACAGPDLPTGGAPRPTARACFRDPLPGEVTAAGRKLIGSAQWRDGGAFLQHGSILLVDEQPVVEQLRIQQTNVEAESGAISLAELMGREPHVATLCEALAGGFAAELDRPVRKDELTAGEREAVGSLEARYADPAWTWRR